MTSLCRSGDVTAHVADESVALLCQWAVEIVLEIEHLVVLTSKMTTIGTDL